MPARGFLARRSRLSTILLVLLGLFLLGTVAVLSTAKAYFSIDKSAYILPEELGNWEEIRWGTGADSPLRWASKYPWLYKLLHPSATPEAIAEAKLALLAASEGAANIAPPLRDNSAKPADPASPPEKIPRIIHQTWKEDALPPKWQSVRDECAAIHPDYEYKLWTDASSRAFIAEYYPWFLSTFDSYPYNIQRADAIRYFVLHHYGGIYMDLDIGCTRRLDPLLRFEVILPVTRPVGVSNDLIFAAKGHPFTDQLIHNLITFNHVYLSHYPTVMFSTGPMFVSASYGLYVDSHGAASPSTPDQPAMGFQGVRVLPKSLYGKNAKPAEVPDAFFKHYYGSSWHAGDAGFLIFLRDHGRLLMFFGACIVAYGFCKALLPKALFSFRKSQHQRHSSASRNSSRRRTSGLGTTDQWVGLPFQTTTTTTASRPTKKRQGISRSFSQTPDTRLDMDSLELSQLSGAAAGPSRTHRPSSRSKSSVTASDVKSAAKPPALSVAAPKPQRATLPFFELQEDEDEDEAARLSPTSSHASSTDEPRGILASWSAAAAATVSGVNGAAGLPHDSRPGSSLGSQSDYGSNGRGSRWRQATTGVLLLPAYALKRMGSPGFGFGRERSSDGDSDELSPSDSLSSLTSEGASSGEQPVWRSRRNSLRSGGASSVVGWAAQMLPSGWRGPVTTDSGGGGGGGGGAHVEERRPLQGGGDLEEDLGDGDVEARRSSAERLAAQSKSRRGRGGSAWLDTAPPDSADAHATTTSSSKRPPTASIPLSRQPSNATSAGGDTPYETVATPTQYLRPVAAAELESRTPPPPYAASTTPTGVSGSGGGTKES